MTVKLARKAKRKAQSNPVTATGSIGIVVAIVGTRLGWSVEAQRDIATLFLLSLPVVNFITSKWFPSLGSSSEEYYDDAEAAAEAEE